MGERIIFDSFERTDRCGQDGYFFTWKNNGQVVHTLEVSTSQLWQRYPPCPACLMHRGELVKMGDLAPNGLEMCPVCSGVRSPTYEPCICGSIPHQVGCPMDPGMVVFP